MRKWWMVAFLLGLGRAQAPSLQLLWDRGVRLQTSLSGCRYYRSYQPLRPELLSNPSLAWCPVPAWDRELADGTGYCYLALGPSGWAQAGPIQTPPRALPALRRPRIWVDKGHYLLTVLDGQQVVKRYPIALGKQPRKRKLCFDNASTPEGRYRICNLQPQATFHRAYDVDYPNAADRARHRLLAWGTEIGGEIQIHGCGTERNWTFGCMAMRDADVDELFAHPEISVGTPLWIFGGEISLADLQSDAAGPSLDPLEIGRKQKAWGLPVTCLLDVATRSKLGM